MAEWEGEVEGSRSRLRLSLHTISSLARSLSRACFVRLALSPVAGLDLREIVQVKRLASDTWTKINDPGGADGREFLLGTVYVYCERQQVFVSLELSRHLVCTDPP